MWNKTKIDERIGGVNYVGKANAGEVDLVKILPLQ